MTKMIERDGLPSKVGVYLFTKTSLLLVFGIFFYRKLILYKKLTFILSILNDLTYSKRTRTKTAIDTPEREKGGCERERER